MFSVQSCRHQMGCLPKDLKHPYPLCPMSPNDIVQIGPLAMALDRLVALIFILVFLAGMEHLMRRFGSDRQKDLAHHIVGIALLVGLVAARTAYVWSHRESFALDPAEALYVWLGGWSWSAGVVAAAAALALMLRKARPLVPALGLLAALAAAWSIFAEGQSSRSPMRLPDDMPIAMVDGGSTTARELRGKPLVLNLWASWCPPCRREMPMLDDAANRETRARILLVNQGEAADRVRAFLQAEGLSARHVAHDPQGALGTFAASPALPTTLFVAADGTVRQVHVGEISRVQLDIAIRAAGEAGSREDSRQ